MYLCSKKYRYLDFCACRH